MTFIDKKMLFIKLARILICGVLTSMFYFPFEFRVLPGLNTKMMLAAVALVLLFLKMVFRHNLTASRDFLYLSAIAVLVSFCGIFAVTYNNTTDYAYATYITSAWVWWGAAYTVCQYIKLVHGRLSWQLVVNYLIAACVFQCIIAFVMDNNLAVKQFVNSIALQEDLVFEGNVHRLYGIGAMLDVAGMRFAAVLVMIVYLLANSKVQKRWYEYLLYFSSFIIITVAGNVIARTTLIGALVGLVYLAVITLRQTKHIEHNYNVMWCWIAGLLAVSIPLLVISYQTDPKMRDRLRFGFEGFFNYFEHGSFDYTSNETLSNMYIWPDNAKTWIIGDGYFSNPINTDPYYTGEITRGFYKGTDVGYLRFIYYFGVVGLLAFSFYMLKVGQICIRKFPQRKWLFVMLLGVHFIVWAKVATDLFLVFALFLCLDAEREEDIAPSILLPHENSLPHSRHV